MVGAVIVGTAFGGFEFLESFLFGILKKIGWIVGELWD